MPLDEHEDRGVHKELPPNIRLDGSMRGERPAALTLVFLQAAGKSIELQVFRERERACDIETEDGAWPRGVAQSDAECGQPFSLTIIRFYLAHTLPVIDTGREQRRFHSIK